MKVCTNCFISKNETEFFKTKNNNLRGECKDCFNVKRKERYNKNKQKELERNKIYRQKNKEKIYLLNKTYQKVNKEKVNTYKKKWLENNLEKRKEVSKRYQRKKREDNYYRILDAFRSSFYLMLKKNSASKKFKLLKYNREDLIKRIESTWTEGMNWDNYGKNGWHIDHIKPLSSFDINKQEELNKAWDLNNLQALWASENLSKSSKYMGIMHRYGNTVKK